MYVFIVIIWYLSSSGEIREVGNLDFSPSPVLGELVEATASSAINFLLCKIRKLTRPSVEFLPIQMECLSCTVSCKDSSRLSGLQIVLSFWSPAGLSRLLDSHGESASVSGFLQGSTSVYFSPRPVPLPAPQSCCRQLPGGERGKDSIFLFLPRCVFLPWGSLL